MTLPLGLHPFRVEARLDDKPWGGRLLAGFGFPLPRGRLIGEAVITAPDAIVVDGAHAGSTLQDLVSLNPAGMIGKRGLSATGARNLFPLLVKVIDAAQTLSVQVHPDDDRAPPGHLGKTEAYHVLRAEPEGRIALGLEPGVSAAEFATACRAGDGATNRLLRWLPAIPGETILIPAGTVHALGGGCIVYEVQQQSDVTYRFDDGGRRDSRGQRRQLHVDDGLRVLDLESRPEPITPILLSTGQCRRSLLTACRYLALEKLDLEAGASAAIIASDGPNVVTLLAGAAHVEASHGGVELVAGETAIIPAAADVCTIHAHHSTTLLRAWIPDLQDDIVKAGRAAGAKDEQIMSLAGALPDLRQQVAEPDLVPATQALDRD